MSYSNPGGTMLQAHCVQAQHCRHHKMHGPCPGLVGGCCVGTLSKLRLVVWSGLVLALHALCSEPQPS